MKIEIHSGMHENPQAGNHCAHMVGKASRVAFHGKNLPGFPKKHYEKD